MHAVLLATNAAEQVELNDVGDLVRLVTESVQGLVADVVADLPLYLVGAVLFGVGVVGARFAMRFVERGVAGMDDAVRRLVVVVVRVLLLSAVAMVALSVAGVDVGAALAALGLLGLAFAFAFQNILENFIAGILILLRRPFRVGDQIISGDHEGTVTDIDMRVTKLRTYDGVNVLLPNADVFRMPMVNLTEAGVRRTTVTLGVDYRDDHDAVADVVLAALAEVEGVLPDPAPQVLCTGLGDSSVDFDVRFWTRPTMADVTTTRDRVVRATKSAVEGAGMSIPWPIRTLEAGMGPLRLDVAERTDATAG